MTISKVVPKALDSGCEVQMVGLNFGSAFDSVNHEALNFNLRQLGLVGVYLSLLIEFLVDTAQGGCRLL